MIFNELKADIKQKLQREHPYFGSGGAWKQSHYQQISAIINQELQNSALLKGERLYQLGNTISPITLRRFFENKYDKSTTNDLRFLKSVDKLAIFLGYDDFVSFTRNKSEKGHTPITTELYFYLSDYIRKICQAELDAYRLLPNLTEENFPAILSPESPVGIRLKNGFRKYAEEQMLLVNRDNGCGFQVYNISVVSLSETECVCEAQESWDLLFLHADGREITYRQQNTQNYFFKKIDGEWLFWDNYNPNAGTVLEEIGTTETQTAIFGK